MKRNKFINVFALSLAGLITTGCWDLVEVDQRAMVTALGIDLQGEEIGITYTIPNFPVLTGQGSGGSPRFVKKTTGSTFLETNKNFNKISDLRLTFEHTQAIVFGSDLLHMPQKLKDALDYFDRSPDYAKSIAVVATDKTAGELLGVTPNSQKLIGLYIASLFNPQSGEVVSDQKVTLNDFLCSLYDTNGCGQLPLIINKDKEVQMDGIVFLKDYEKKLTLPFDQLAPYDWVCGTGSDTIENVDYKETKLSYEISQVSRKVKIKETDDGLDIQIIVQTEGDIDEFILDPKENVFKSKTVSEIEKLLAEKMGERMNEMVLKIQKQLAYDAFNIAGRIKMQNGRLWEKIKDDYDAYFTSAKITIEVEPHIRRIGMSK
ncbi:MAG: Ger(x)C family spore germination protein [Vallitaleaceae bacterium]|nr:Ger(x)C family spore germination protein [Vallitaleaceae bacterium]